MHKDNERVTHLRVELSKRRIEMKSARRSGAGEAPCEEGGGGGSAVGGTSSCSCRGAGVEGAVMGGEREESAGELATRAFRSQQ